MILFSSVFKYWCSKYNIFILDRNVEYLNVIALVSRGDFPIICFINNN